MILLLALVLGAGEISESELVTQVDGKEAFAPAFRGHWASTAAACKAQDDGGIEITADHIYGYEWDAVLLKTTPMIWQSAGPTGRDTAYTVVVLLAGRAESDVNISKLRISRFGAKLYMSNAERVKDEKHLTAEFANVRCP
jgi:hypothetical protein